MTIIYEITHIVAIKEQRTFLFKTYLNFWLHFTLENKAVIGFRVVKDFVITQLERDLLSFYFSVHASMHK
jgi:hypothetical protein